MSFRLQTLRAFIKKEVTQSLRDNRMKVLLFISPMMQLTLFGIALSSETRNIKLAVMAKPSDVLMQDLEQRALGTGWFVKAKTSGNDPVGWINSNEAEAVLIAPDEGLGRSIARNRGEIQLLLDGQNGSRAQAIEGYLRSIASTVYATGNNLTKMSSISFDVRALYNPTMKSSFYMVPGVLSMLVCLITVLLTSMAIAREKEVGTIETLTASPIDALDLMLGKTIPFLILGAVQISFILIFAVIAFGLPVKGPLWMLTIASFLIIMATVSIGLLVSTIARNQQQAMFGGFIFLMPSFLLSGLMFPIENMPIYIQAIAYINPLTHYMGLLRNILLVGGDPVYFLQHSLCLLVIAVAMVSFAIYRFKSVII